MEPVLFISALTALFSLSLSIVSIFISIKAVQKPNRAARPKKKKSREERESEKEERLYRVGVENILGYWPIEKEGKKTEDGKLRDF